MTKKVCRECAFYKPMPGNEEAGICTYFNVIQNADASGKCKKHIRIPTKDEQDMHDITTVPLQNRL